MIYKRALYIEDYKKHKKGGYEHLKFMLLFSVIILYFEAVFKIFTAGNIFGSGFFPRFFFSIAYGGLGYLLSSLFPKEKINKTIASCLIFLTGLLYIIQFLIYKQFKQFYDISTMAGGASDALTSYFSDLLRLIFPQGGIFVILLFFLPFVLYLIFSNKFLPALQSKAIVRLISVATSVFSYILAIILVFTSSIHAPVYRDQYNFQSAVSSFGLITGMRLDIQNKLFGNPLTFEQPEIPVQGLEPTAPPEENDPGPTTQPVITGDNIIDLDFDLLNQNASAEIQALNTYVQSLTPSQKNEYTGLFRGKNLIMITAEAFSAEVINPSLTPTLYRLATKGINFTDYYQPASAGTTGGEYQNIFGMMPTDGGKSFKNTANHLNYYTMGSQLNRLGYYGKAFHNNSYTYYDRNITHNNLGYSDGFMGYGNGMEQYVKNYWPQSDYEMISGTLPTYIDKQPFNIYYMSVSGHSGYTRSGNSMTNRHWDRVKDLPYSDAVKGYLAANLDLEDALTYLVDELESKGIADDTVICISTDHFPYGLDTSGALGNMPNLSELYGNNVTDYFQRDHSRLILWSGCLENREPIIVDSPTFSLDILPTLSNLFGTEFDSRLMVGRDVLSNTPALIFNTNYDWKTDLGTYYASKNEFIPKDGTIAVPDSYISTIKTMVSNKMKYCSGVLDTDYFRHVFGQN